jgi:hypothetical protein
MTKMTIVIASVLAIGAGSARADTPAWCKEAHAESPRLDHLASKDVREVLRAFVGAACAPTAESDAHRAEIEQARAAWAARLGLQESDWRDVAAYVASAYYNDDTRVRTEPSTPDLAAATPIDQYVVIKRAIADMSSVFDAVYLADVFDSRLSEPGRLAFLEDCLRDEWNLGVLWAVCEEDFARFDAARLFAQVRSDTAQPGELRMKIRLGAYRLPERIKAHREAVAKLMASDEAWKKVFELAQKARAEWTAAVGGEAKLLATVTKLDSATLARSRKLFEGCDAETMPALADAASRIPAKTFTNMKDIRDDPFHGFAKQALPLVVRDPRFHLAAIGVAECQARPNLGNVLASALKRGPGARGPRDYALGRIATSDIQLDKVGATIVIPQTRRPYASRGAAPASVGGAVERVTKSGDELVVKLQPLMVKRDDCVQEHRTNRVERIRDDGKVMYELQCDQTATVVHDEQWSPLKVSARYQALIKPGVVISVVGDQGANDLVAVWPSVKSPVPSWVFGGGVK